MKPCYKVLGLDRFLREKKISNKQLDRLLGGWSVSRVAHIRNGRDRATLEEVQAIAKALGVDFDELGPVEGRRAYFRRETYCVLDCLF